MLKINSRAFPLCINNRDTLSLNYFSRLRKISLSNHLWTWAKHKPELVQIFLRNQKQKRFHTRTFHFSDMNVCNYQVRSTFREKALIRAWRSFYISNPHTRTTTSRLLLTVLQLKHFFSSHFSVYYFSMKISCCDFSTWKQKLSARTITEIKASTSAPRALRWHKRLKWRSSLRHRLLWHISICLSLLQNSFESQVAFVLQIQCINHVVDYYVCAQSPA